MKHFEWYSTDTIYSDTIIVAAKSYYQGYPLASFHNEGKLAIVDGAIYNKSPKKVTEELMEIGAIASLDQKKESIKQFVRSTQGEFVIAEYNKQFGRLIVFNDALGRLPFYYSSLRDDTSDPIVASREMNFVVPFPKIRDFDPISVAEYLLFGYVLGCKTLLKEVKRLLPSTILVLDVGNKELYSEEMFKWNLDSKDDVGDIHQRAAKLAKLFTVSLRDIVATFPKDYTHVVALSGGLDSRATLGGFAAAGYKPVACSFPSGEDRIEEEIANKLGIKHHLISSPYEITFEDHLRTFGLMDIGLRSRVTYLFGLREKIGDKTLLYTGDGGDKTLAPLRCRSSNLEELLRHLVESEHIYDLDAIGSMLRIDIEEFKNHLRKHFSGYPEKTVEGKLAHFKIFERGFNWLFLGEDRSRFFMWSTTPFYSVPFFEAAMNIPQSFKANYILYKYFLADLDRRLPMVRYYNRFIPLAFPDWMLRIYFSVFDMLKERYYKLGSFNPVDFVRGGRNRSENEEKSKLRKFAQISLVRKGSFDLLETPIVSKSVGEETNDLKLEKLATLITYMDFLSTLWKDFENKVK
jgi:asparagine synthase (glutamine-hydrolysing)